MTARISRHFTAFGSAKCLGPCEAYSDDGGKTWRWASNNTFLSLDTCKDFGVPCDPAAQEAALSDYLDAFAREYRNRQPLTPSAEQQAEMLAAFGPGQVVVDVISGRRHRT